MNYSILGQDLYETADGAKAYFAKHYGARGFVCEAEVQSDLPLRPTWQATLNGGYLLCVEVRDSPFSNSLYGFVTKCAASGMPVRLWVAIRQGTAGPLFSAELRQAREVGVGVVEIADDGTAHELHKPVALSLFGLKKTDIKRVPRGQREDVKNAEDAFLNGSPAEGCQAICQILERLTRDVAEHTYNRGWWKQSGSPAPRTTKFFQTDSWAAMLEDLEDRLDISKVRTICPSFSKQMIVKARAQTDWRNSVSHKPKNLKALQARDAKLRTMYEATRDLLIEWYCVGKALKLVK